MKRTPIRARNPRTTELKKFISQRHDAIIERDEHAVFEGTKVGLHCMFFFTPIQCQNFPVQIHEVIPRGRSRREAQRKWFVDENQVGICLSCESVAQTKAGRNMLQDAMTRVYGYSYDEKGYWERYYDDNEKGIV